MKTNHLITQVLAVVALAAITSQPSTGFAQGTATFPVATNHTVTQYSAGLATDGTNYLYVFSSGGSNCAQLVSATGTLLGSPIILGGGANGLPPELQVVSGRTNYLVAWSDSSINSGVDIFGQFISRSGTKVGSEFPLLANVGSHGYQGIESLATDGTNFLVIWDDEAGLTGTSTVPSYGQLITPAGILSGSEFLVASVGAALGGQDVSVAFGKTNYLAVWQSGYYQTGNDGHYTTYGALISPSGVVGTPFAISQTNSPDNNGFTVLAFDGTNFLATWGYNPVAGTSPIDWRTHGRLVSPQGNFPGNELAMASESSLMPAVAFDGSNYLMAWSYHGNTTNTDKSIHLCFFDRIGSPIGPIFSVFSAQGTNAPLFPGLGHGVAFDGNRFALGAMLGTVSIDEGGDFQGIPSSQVYGAFLPASTAPPRLGLGAAYANQQFSLSLSGTPGINYAIQASTNLGSPNWMPLVTNSPTSGTLTFSDPNATNHSRFYRALKQ